MPADIQARLKKIGKQCGCVSIGILNDLIPEEKDASFIDQIFDFLEKNKIKIVETLPADKKANLEDGDDGDGDSSSDQGQKLEPAQEVEETTTTYLREMGRFDLLNRGTRQGAGMVPC